MTRRIRDVMSPAAVAVEPMTTVARAARLMREEDVGDVLVTYDCDLFGVLTDRDIVLRGVARGIPTDSRIDALMTTEVITVPSGVDLERAYEIFRDHAIRRLPVVDGRRLVGLLSVDDLLIRTEHEMAELVHPLADEVFAPHREAPPLATTGEEPVELALELPPRRRAMRAHPGDTLVVHRPTVTQPDRLGEILEVRSPAGDPPFTVRWSDTGHVSFVYPGPDAEVRHPPEEARSGTG